MSNKSKGDELLMMKMNVDGEATDPLTTGSGEGSLGGREVFQVGKKSATWSFNLDQTKRMFKSKVSKECNAVLKTVKEAMMKECEGVGCMGLTMGWVFDTRGELGHFSFVCFVFSRGTLVS